MTARPTPAGFSFEISPRPINKILGENVAEERVQYGHATADEAGVDFDHTVKGLVIIQHRRRRRALSPKERVRSEPCPVGIRKITDTTDEAYNCHSPITTTEVISPPYLPTRWMTYIEPAMNTRDMPVFCLRESCSFQTIGSGSTNMIKSVMKFKEPYM